MLKGLWNIFADLLYPRRCILCAKLLEHRSEICRDCSGYFEVRFMQGGIFERSYLDSIILSVPYAQVRRVFHQAKFAGRKENLNVLGRAFAGCWQANHEDYLFSLTGVELRNCLVTTMPTDISRRAKRGYDIPKLLFAPWLAANNLPHEYLLRRVRPTEAQFSLSRPERKANVAESMTALRELNGADVILLDDIFTTGASMNEGARVLKLHGARRVVGLALASDFD